MFRVLTWISHLSSYSACPLASWRLVFSDGRWTLGHCRSRMTCSWYSNLTLERLIFTFDAGQHDIDFSSSFRHPYLEEVLSVIPLEWYVVTSFVQEYGLSCSQIDVVSSSQEFVAEQRYLVVRPVIRNDISTTWLLHMSRSTMLSITCMSSFVVLRKRKRVDYRSELWRLYQSTLFNTCSSTSGYMIILKLCQILSCNVCSVVVQTVVIHFSLISWIGSSPVSSESISTAWALLLMNRSDL